MKILKGKWFFHEKNGRKEKVEGALKLQSKSLFCAIYSKKFHSAKKLDEHLISKVHLKNKTKKDEEKKEEEISITFSKNEIKIIKSKEPEKTTLDDNTFCLFCNIKSGNLKHNFYYMMQTLNLEIPFIFYIKSYKEFIKILTKKIFLYYACFTCDTQRFESIRSLQRHNVIKRPYNNQR